jgi:phage-related protein
LSELASRFVSIIPSFKGGARQISRELDGIGDSAGKSAGKKAGGGFVAGMGGSLKGFAGGMLATMGIGALVSGFNSATNAASDLNETVNKAGVIFGKNFASMDKWAQGAATSLGLSRQAALDAAAGFGDMFSQIGFAGGEAAKMSKSVVQMSADLGSFNNLGTDDVADRISAAFRGEYDSLQKVIPNINAARVEHEALAATGKKTAKELTAAEKATAVLAIVQNDGARAMGDFAKTADGAANAQKILAAKTEDVKARFGQALLPVRLFIVQGLSKLLDVAPKVGRFLAPVGSALKQMGAVASQALSILRGDNNDAANGVSWAGPVLDAVARIRAGFVAMIPTVQAFVGWLRGTLVPAFLGVVGALRGWYAQVLAIVQQVATGMMTRLAPLMPAVRTIFSTIGQIVSVALQFVQAVIQRVTQVIGFIWTNWGQGIMNTVATVFAAVVGIVQPALNLIKGIISLVLSLIKGDWSGAWEAMKQILSAAWELIKGIVSGAIAVVKSVLSLAWDVIKSVAGAAWEGVKSLISSAWEGIKSLVSTAVENVKTSMSLAWDSIKSTASSAWDRIKTAVSDKISSMVSTVREIPGKVTSALSGLGSLLYNKGAELIQGLIDGIKSKIAAIGDAMGAIAGKVKGFLPGSPVKEGPLRSWNNGGAGKRLGGLLADGLDASRATVAAASARMASSVQLGAKVPAFAGAPGQMGTEGASGPSQPLVVNLVLPDGRVLGRTVIDDISGRRRRP